MDSTQQFEILADYNRWMNEKIYGIAADLPPEELAADKGAFFGSLLGTLNHLVVADTIWLKRFVAHPSCKSALESIQAVDMPVALDQILFQELEELSEHRRWLDGLIFRWVEALNDEDLNYLLDYKNRKGISSRRRFGSLMLHFFNHQTHHRGQATTLLFQMGRDPGVTDLLLRVPEEE